MIRGSERRASDLLKNLDEKEEMNTLTLEFSRILYQETEQFIADRLFNMLYESFYHPCREEEENLYDDIYTYLYNWESMSEIFFPNFSTRKGIIDYFCTIFSKTNCVETMLSLTEKRLYINQGVPYEIDWNA